MSIRIFGWVLGVKRGVWFQDMDGIGLGLLRFCSVSAPLSYNCLFAVRSLCVRWWFALNLDGSVTVTIHGIGLIRISVVP